MVLGAVGFYTSLISGFIVLAAGVFLTIVGLMLLGFIGSILPELGLVLVGLIVVGGAVLLLSLATRT